MSFRYQIDIEPGTDHSRRATQENKEMRLVVILCLAMAGCATAAQRQGEQIKTGLGAAEAEMKACVAAMNNDPSYAGLQQHFPFNDIRQATLAQMTDDSLVSSSDVALMSSRRSIIIGCESKLEETLSRVLPPLVPIIVETRTEQDNNLLDLVKHKASWGAYVVRSQAIIASQAAKMQAVFHQVDAELAAANQQELAQRQAAAAAYSQYMQTQQIINNANRPVTTNCNRFGNSVNCTTY
jgi:hypothetical protein